MGHQRGGRRFSLDDLLTPAFCLHGEIPGLHDQWSNGVLGQREHKFESLARDRPGFCFRTFFICTALNHTLDFSISIRRSACDAFGKCSGFPGG